MFTESAYPHPDVEPAIERFHKTSGKKVVYAFAGGGAQALCWLHAINGSTRTMVEAIDLYSKESMEEFIHETPDKAVCEATAIKMATLAAVRGQWMGQGVDCVGLAVTAAVATERKRKSEDQAFIAVCSGKESDCFVTHIWFKRDSGMTRRQQETIISSFVIDALVRTTGRNLDLPVLTDNYQVQTLYQAIPDSFWQVIHGQQRAYTFMPDGQEIVGVPKDAEIIIPGSFNPLHQGHIEIAEAAVRLTGKKSVYFEMTVFNTDKGTMTHSQAAERISQFRWKYPVVLTNLRLLVDKAEAFRMCDFAIGADTAERILDVKYYGGTEGGLHDMLCGLKHFGARLLIMGRQYNGAFKSVKDLKIPRGFEDLFIELPGRLDLSSTELRGGQQWIGGTSAL